MTDKERITMLEQRLATLEGRLAVLEQRAAPPLPYNPSLPMSPYRMPQAGDYVGWPVTTNAAWVVDPQSGQISV
jgi:hypothetical protein